MANKAAKMYSPPAPGGPSGKGGGPKAVREYVGSQPVPKGTNPPHKKGSHGGFTSKPE